MKHSPGIVIDRGCVYIRIWPEGRRGRPFRQYFGPANGENLARAEYKLREYRNQVANGRFNVPEQQARITVNEACDVYWELHVRDRPSRVSYQASLKHIRDAWGSRMVRKGGPSPHVSPKIHARLFFANKFMRPSLFARR